MFVAEIQQFDQRRPWHKCERSTRELDGIHMFTHGFEDILQVALAHRGVIGAADLGKAKCARFCLALVTSRKGTLDQTCTPPPHPSGPRLRLTKASGRRLGFSRSATASAMARRSAAVVYGSAKRSNFQSHIPPHRLREEAGVIPHLLTERPPIAKSNPNATGHLIWKPFRIGFIRAYRDTPQQVLYVRTTNSFKPVLLRRDLVIQKGRCEDVWQTVVGLLFGAYAGRLVTFVSPTNDV